MYLKHDDSDIGFSLRHQVERTQLGPIDMARLELGVETENSCIYWVQLSRFRLKTATESSLRRFMFKIKEKTMIMLNILIVILIYRH
jgi:hypothetical protein